MRKLLKVIIAALIIFSAAFAFVWLWLAASAVYLGY